MRQTPDRVGQFIELLTADGQIRAGGYTARVRFRRWRNGLYTQARYPEEGTAMWRAFFFVALVIGGYPAQLVEQYVLKGIPVTRADGRAGLDLRPSTVDGVARWKVIGLWASPIGHGYGRELLATVVEAADTTDTVLLLQAANRHLARTLYALFGFEERSGQESVKRPWMERQPMPGRPTTFGAASCSPSTRLPSARNGWLWDPSRRASRHATPEAASGSARVVRGSGHTELQNL